MTARPRIVLLALVSAVVFCTFILPRAETQSSLRRFTNTSAEGININPSISGDGRIADFESTEDVAGAGGANAFRAIRANISVDPATFFQMGRTRAVAPAISQDGSRIAFASKDDPTGTNADGNSEIFLFNGANLLQITNTTPNSSANRVTEGNFQPSISDDGRYVAFSSNRNLTSQNGDANLEIFIFDSVAATFTQLTNSSGIVGFSDAKISGDGLSVACIRDLASSPGPNRDLLRINRLTAAQTVLASNVARLTMTYGRAISDDGTRIAYSAETAANTTQLFFFDGRGGNVNRDVTALGARVTEVPLHPTISGDGRRIAFATRRAVTGFSNSDASVELYTYDIPTGTFARVTSAPTEADCFDGSSAACEVVSSLNDDGSTVVFNFPRALSGAVPSGVENKSEIYATALVPRPPFGTLTAVLNQASHGHEPSPVKAVAPNSIAAAFGSSLASSTQQPQKLPDGTFPTNVAGTSVTVNGRIAQIFFVSSDRVHFLVPSQTEIGTAEVVVTNADGFASKGNVPILLAAPGVFTRTGDGIGEGMIVNADTLAEGPFDPTGGNLRLLIFATGVRNGASSIVNIGGRVANAQSVIASPDMPGLDEVRVVLPADLRGAGTVNLFIQTDGRQSNPVTVTFTGDSSRNVLFNEVLADPPDGIAGDANHDGVRDGTDDEFIELVNGTSNEDISLGGWTLRTRATGSTTENTRFTFPSGTSLPAGEAILVFGGGNFNPADTVFGCAQVLKVTTTAGLSLTNSGLTILLRNAAGSEIASFIYGGSTGIDGDNNQSLTRSPDITGLLVQHTSAADVNGRSFSPGLRTSGAPFGTCATAVARIEVTPSPATIEVGGQQQFNARAFDSNNNEVTGVTFNWQSANTSIATIDQNGLASGASTGQTNITASASGVTSAAAVLNVNPATPVLTSVTIAPASATVGVGETQQFTGQAKDQFGNNIGSVTVSFTSSSSTLATVDATNAAPATGSATAIVTGRASGVAQVTAHASNGATTVHSPAASLTVEPGAGQLLIGEFRTRGPQGASDEFVEIYNPTTTTLLIGGLRIRASNSAGTISDRITITAGTTLGPGCHYLVANNSASGYSGATPPNQTYSTGITDDGGVAITRANGTTVIDQVGMSAGSAFKEGTTLTPLAGASDQSYERKPGRAFGNGMDTNDNAADFLLNASSSNPLNSSGGCLNTAGADLSITKTDSPDPVTIGSNITYTITVLNNGAATAQNVLVTDNLPSEVAFVSCGATGGAVCEGTGNNRTVMLTSLASGASFTVTLVATANGPDGATATNTATVSSTTADPNSGNDSSTATTLMQAPAPSLSIDDVTAVEGTGGTTNFVFTVTLTPANSQTVTVNFVTSSTSPATAAAGTDYVTTSGMLTFTPTDTSEQITIQVNGDTSNEAICETFFVTLSSPVNATISDDTGQGGITDDDGTKLVISQIYGGGGNASATFTNDFIEIFNRGNAAVSLNGMSVQYVAATTTTGSWSKTDLPNVIIHPGQYFLVQQASGGANGSPLPTPDATGTINMAAGSGRVALVNSTTALSATSCPFGATIIDLVGYGSTAICREGSTTADNSPGPSNNTTSAQRDLSGCQDVNNNNTDFAVAAVNPRNSSTTVDQCDCGDTFSSLFMFERNFWRTSLARLDASRSGLTARVWNWVTSRQLTPITD